MLAGILALSAATSTEGEGILLMGLLLLTDRWVALMAPLLRLYAKAQWPPGITTTMLR